MQKSKSFSSLSSFFLLFICMTCNLYASAAVYGVMNYDDYGTVI